jgi:hypothetical protein
VKEHLHESQFIDLGDEQLKEALGFLWEGIKNLTDAKKNDPQIEKMKGELKAYTDEHYAVEIKRLSKLLKAARVVAKLRGVQWKLPEDTK